MKEGLYFGANGVTFLNINIILIVERKANLMHNLFFVLYFVNLYMFSGVSRPIIRRYNRNQPTQQSHLKRIINTNCCTRTVVPPDDGSRHARQHVAVDEIY